MSVVVFVVCDTRMKRGVGPFVVTVPGMDAVDDRILSDDAFRELSLTAKILFLWRVHEGSPGDPDAQTRPPFMTDEAFAWASIQLAPRLDQLKTYLTTRLPIVPMKPRVRGKVINLDDARRRLRRAA